MAKEILNREEVFDVKSDEGETLQFKIRGLGAGKAVAFGLAAAENDPEKMYGIALQHGVVEIVSGITKGGVPANISDVDLGDILSGAEAKQLVDRIVALSNFDKFAGKG